MSIEPKQPGPKKPAPETSSPETPSPALQAPEVPTPEVPGNATPDAELQLSPAGLSAEARPSARLLEFLVCPTTKSPLELSPDHTELRSKKARVAYPIRDGIPLLTADTARELRDDELRK